MTKGKGSNPGAGGLGKHIKSVAHRERAQPANRKRLGPLEKHKDYVKRSGRRKERTKRVQQLKRAAALRNTDEFNVKMTQYKTNAQTGKMERRVPASSRANDAALKQAIEAGKVDERFLERKAKADTVRARQLSASIGGLQLAPENRHTVFVESPRDVAKFKPEKYFDTTKAMLAAPALRGSIKTMGTTRVAHALDRVDDATLMRRFNKGDFDWDDELRELRVVAPAADNNDDEDDNHGGRRAAAAAAATAAAPLEDSRSLRDSLLGAEKKQSGVTPAVLLRMLRRAAVLEAQRNEEANQTQVARSAREVVERVKRAGRLHKLAAVVKKRASGQTNRIEERLRQKFRPGVTRRTK